jgi:hypothetical protein
MEEFGDEGEGFDDLVTMERNCIDMSHDALEEFDR